MARMRAGNAGEAAVLNAFVERHFDVLVPFGEGHPYDLVVAIEDDFLRVQCKTAWPYHGCLIWNAHSTDHGKGALSYLGRADVFGVYFPLTGAVYVVPVDLMGSEGRLRLEPTRNNQRRRIRFAGEYEIDRWTKEALHDIAVTGRSHSEQLRIVAG